MPCSPPAAMASAARVLEVPQLGERAAAWDDLVEAAPLPSAFLTSWWLAGAASQAAGPVFVLVLDGDELVGGLALDEDRRLGVRRLRLLGDGPTAPDHLDLVARPGREAVVVRAVRRWLAARAPLLADLRGVAPDAHLLRALPGRVLVTRITSAPHLVLRPEVPPRPRQGATNLTRQSRRLARDGADYRVVGGEDPDELDRAMADLLTGHVERWEGATGFVRGFEAVAGAVRCGAATGAVQVHELVGPEGVVASELTLDVGGRRQMYQTGRSTEHRWRGAGNVLQQRVIADAWERGFHDFDFLRGQEPYKYRWTELERPVLRVRAGLGRGPAAAVAVAAASERGRPAARRVKAWLRERRARRPR